MANPNVTPGLDAYAAGVMSRGEFVEGVIRADLDWLEGSALSGVPQHVLDQVGARLLHRTNELAVVRND